MWEYLKNLDKELFIYLNNLGIEKYDQFWIFVTKIEHWTPLYLLFFILYFTIYKKKNALIGVGLTVATFIITLLLTNITKFLVARLRPNNSMELEGLIRVLQSPSNYSFFSGHAAVSCAVTTFVVCAMRRKYSWVYVFLLWPFLFILSRIFVGVHYPSDLFIGAIIGSSIGLLLWKVAGKKHLSKSAVRFHKKSH